MKCPDHIFLRGFITYDPRPFLGSNVQYRTFQVKLVSVFMVSFGLYSCSCFNYFECDKA